jgi:hypothetical protein
MTTYDLNGNRTRDVAQKMNADNHSAYLSTTSDYTRLLTLPVCAAGYFYDSARAEVKSDDPSQLVPA